MTQAIALPLIFSPKHSACGFRWGHLQPNQPQTPAQRGAWAWAHLRARERLH